MIRKYFNRRNAVVLMLVVLVLALTAVSAFAQTPVPPPTSDELVTSTFEGITTHVPIIPIAAVAILIISMVMWAGKRLVKIGR